MENSQDIKKNNETSEEKINYNDIINKKVPLSEVVKYCKKYYFKKITNEEFMEWADNIMILQYLPIQQKTQQLIKIILKYNMLDTDSCAWAMYFEMYKFWYGLLAYTNIDLTGCESDITIENYDYLMQTLAPILKIICAIDYSVLDNMIDAAIQVENLQKFYTSLEMINPDTLEQANLDVKETLQVLNDNPKLLKQIITLLTNSKF